jgi:hypothetical protein
MARSFANDCRGPARGLTRQLLPQPLDEPLDRDISLPQDRAQRSAIQLLVIWHNDLGKGFIPAQDDVAAVLPADAKTRSR